MYKILVLSNDILDEYVGAAGKNKIFMIGLKMLFQTRV